MKLFGYNIFGSGKVQQSDTFSQPENLEGLQDVGLGGAFFSGIGVSFDNTPIEDETKLISKYREIAQNTEVELAIEEIVNEVFVYGEKSNPIEIDLSELPDSVVNKKIKENIKTEFENILSLLDFKNNAFDIFKRWYVDGRLFYETVIDKNNTKKGITELKYIDPRKIRKVREPVLDQNKPKTLQGFYTVNDYVEYYIYNPTGLMTGTPSGLRIAPDTVTYCNSGILDKTNRIVLSNIHKSIRPFNQYKMLKDAMVIYYHTRAPERRIFNVEVGNLPKARAEQYLQETMSRFRRKNTYDPETGSIQDDKRYMTMNDDFWFPRRDGRGTTVDVLSGGANLQELQDVVQMYKDELFESLNIPKSRYKDAANFSLGRPSEISRDEMKFSKFITRLRSKFSYLFIDLLGKQLVLKGIVTADEWLMINNQIFFDYLKDNNFTELKEAEIWSNRFATFRDAESYIGNYFTKEYAVKTFLRYTDEDWESMKTAMKKEADEEPKEPETENPPIDTSDPIDTSVDDTQDDDIEKIKEDIKDLKNLIENNILDIKKEILSSVKENNNVILNEVKSMNIDFKKRLLEEKEKEILSENIKDINI